MCEKAEKILAVEFVNAERSHGCKEMGGENGIQVCQGTTKCSCEVLKAKSIVLGILYCMLFFCALHPVCGIHWRQLLGSDRPLFCLGIFWTFRSCASHSVQINCSLCAYSYRFHIYKGKLAIKVDPGPSCAYAPQCAARLGVEIILCTSLQYAFYEELMLLRNFIPHKHIMNIYFLF